MPLTPDDVHNVVFGRARLGRRGYKEEEVDIFLDLVEDSLIRLIDDKEELRLRNAELRQRNASLEKADAELRQWDSKLRRHRERLRQQEAALRQKANQLRRYEAALRQRAVEQPRELEAPRPRNGGQPRRDLVRQRSKALPAGTDALPARVNEEQSITAVRSIAGAYGKHDLEWMAIRKVAERVGQRMTETVQQQWTRTTGADQGRGAVIPIETAQLQQLRQQNAELSRVNEMLKTLTALFAAEVNKPAQGQLGS